MGSRIRGVVLAGGAWLGRHLLAAAATLDGETCAVRSLGVTERPR